MISVDDINSRIAEIEAAMQSLMTADQRSMVKIMRNLAPALISIQGPDLESPIRGKDRIYLLKELHLFDMRVKKRQCDSHKADTLQAVR
jgi:hypothetical protein